MDPLVRFRSALLSLSFDLKATAPLAQTQEKMPTIQGEFVSVIERGRKRVLGPNRCNNIGEWSSTNQVAAPLGATWT